MIPLDILRGVKFSSGFCLHPSGELAFAVDHFNRCFVKVDLRQEPGQQTAIETEWPTTFDPTIACDIHIAAVERSSKVFIYAILVSKDAKKDAWKIFFVTFSFNKDSVKIVDEQYINVDGSKQTKIDFELDENEGFVWCYSLHRISGNRTVMRATKIEINDVGRVLSINNTKEIVVDKNWQRPFIRASYFHLLPVRGYQFLKQFTKRSINNGNNELITINTFTDNGNQSEKAIEQQLSTMHHCSPGEWIDTKIVFYACNKLKNSGWLLSLDLEQRSLHIVNIEFKDHVITNRARLNYSPKFSKIYLHGNCSASCGDMAHIYIFDKEGILGK